MGNQQGRLAKEFVGGLIVGEGSFSLTHIKQKNGREEYRPMFTIGMCDEVTMGLVVEAFQDWGLALYYYEYLPKGGRRKFCRVQVNGYKRTKRVLEELLPYLTGTKRRAAECMEEFVNARLGLQGRGRYAPFTEDQLALVAELKSINRTG